MRLTSTSPGALQQPISATAPEPKRSKAHEVLPWLTVALIATVMGLLLSYALGVQFDGLLYDQGITMRAPRTTDKVVIVGLDEKFMRRKRAALMPRERLAKLIRVLSTSPFKPSVIVIDIWLDAFYDNDESNSNPHGKDGQLHDALVASRRAGVPVLLAQVSTDGIAGRAETSAFARQSGAFSGKTGVNAHQTTLDYFAKAASGVGSVDALPDADGIFRTLPRSSVGAPSLPLQAALLYAQSHGKPLSTELQTRIQTEKTPIDFLGGPNTIFIHNADELLAHPERAIVFGGKAVFVGATYDKSADLVSTPYSFQSANAQRFFYGVEVLAQSTVTILAAAPRRPYDSPGAWLQIAFWTLVLSLVASGLALRGAAWGIGAFLSLTALACAIALASANAPVAMLGNHYWPASPLLFSILLACIGGIGYRQVSSARELRELTNIFQGHVGKQVLDQIKVRRPELGGEMRDIAVLFCDIRGFSTIGEQLRDDPVQLLALLNEHFEPLVRALERREAYTDNYVGDLVMGVFGAPFSRSLRDDTRHAVLAGVDFVRIMRQRAARQRERGEAIIEAGVGIHCGPAVVGYLGTREHMHYTAVGDTVNIASRIEGTTRNYNEPLLVTEDVVHACGDDTELPAAGWEFVAETKLKGRDAPVKLYRRRDLDALVSASAVS